jgi:signal transduction histidine kinase
MIFIEDTGIGISKEVLQHIQKEFSDNTNSSDGLNLSICKELIDQMGGTFDINSEQGLGTTVWITLPCQASSIKRRKII